MKGDYINRAALSCLMLSLLTLLHTVFIRIVLNRTHNALPSPSPFITSAPSNLNMGICFERNKLSYGSQNSWTFSYLIDKFEFFDRNNLPTVLNNCWGISAVAFILPWAVEFGNWRGDLVPRFGLTFTMVANKCRTGCVFGNTVFSIIHTHICKWRGHVHPTQH